MRGLGGAARFGSALASVGVTAALWCFGVTDRFEQAVVKAANLGEDADTAAAICGQVAEAYYGASAIRSRTSVALREM